MDSNKIIEYAKLFEIKDFIGVFAVDELISIPKRRTGLVIFNTDTSDSIGQHWIALCITKRKILFFDSLVSKFQESPDFNKYMSYTNKELVWNKIQIQSYLSDKCGIHCLVFCYAIQKNKKKKNYENFLKPFFSSSIQERENLSLYYFSLINQIRNI
jgi:hypothetical protein